MRKLIAILLGAVMMLSLAVVGVSAADPEIITTAEQFAAMAADGNYKLGADITIAESYANSFTGSFDGDGYTVTVSAAMFAELSGTVKNLTIQGEVTASGTSSYAAGLALIGKGTITIEKVINKATVTSGFRAGGIIAQINNGATATILDCENYGDITGGSDKSGMVGGILGYQQGNSLVIQNCVNYGKITDVGLSGGIIGRFGGDYTKAKEYTCDVINCLNKGEVVASTQGGGIVGYARSVTITIVNCTNEGKVTSSGSDVAGILGHSNVIDKSSDGGVKNTGNSDIRINKCVNKGEIESTNGRGAGICAYVWSGTGGDSVKTNTEVTNCVNYGAIKGTSYVSQIMAYTNAPENVVKNNVGLGSVAASSGTPKLAFYAFSSAALPAELKDNIIVSDGSEYATWSTETGKEGKDQSRTILIGGSTEKVDGETTIVFKADDYVTVKSEAEAKAAADALGEIGYKAPAAPSDPGTTPVVTGDTAVIVMIIAVVSLLGMGIALKARRA